MAWSWTQSGRFDDFEFELIPMKSVDSKPSKKLTGVTGGTLTLNNDSSEVVSGTLDVVKTGFINNTYVRIWYCPTLGSTKKRIELATCIATTEQGHYEDGIYSGTITLHGVLWRFVDDELHKAYTIKKGESVLGYFKKLFSWLGGNWRISGVKDRKAGANVVFKRKESPMAILQWIAEYVGGYITCDTHGRVVLAKYVSPSNKPVKYTIPYGASSVTNAGIDITDSKAGTPNRVSVGYEWSESYKEGGKQKTRQRTLVGVAAAASSSAVSRQKVGRYITRSYDLNALKPVTQAKIDSIAKTYLKKASATTISYRFSTMSYLPIQLGQVVKLRYDKIVIDGMVRVIEYSLEAGCPMTIELRKVRNG